MHAFLNTALTAARKAGAIIMRGFERMDKVQVMKKSDRDFVTNIDKSAEQAIVSTLKTAYPDHAFWCEESGLTSEGEYQWIIDPLDGTTNFIHSFPHFAISIALRHNSVIEHALIYDPIREDIYTASRGEGALKNNHRLRVSERKEMKEALLGTGFPYRSPQYHEAYYETLKAISKECVGLRRAGSAALDLAYVASGQLDGFFELSLKPWDMAAGILLIKESGGIVTDIHGGENYFKGGDVVAANPKLLRQLLLQLKPLSDAMRAK